MLYNTHTVLLTLLKVSNLMRLAKHPQVFRELIFLFLFSFPLSKELLRRG